jgi:branched-chain amino acid transport system ATP-binding protein
MDADRAPSPLLAVRDLHVTYGGVRAVRGVDLTLDAGELVCLIGANGAGKTSTLNALAGTLPLAGGEIEYDGARIDTVPAHARVSRGIALVPEGRGIFARLTVEENLRLGAYSRKDHAGIEADLKRVHALLPRMRERLHQVAGTLSGGEQQMLAIGRALLSRPRLLLLDEPSMGLAPQMVEKVFDVIQHIAREGVALLLVEQNARLALELATRGYVMDTGRITLEGRGADLLEDPRVRQAYLGEPP